MLINQVFNEAQESGFFLGHDSDPGNLMIIALKVCSMIKLLIVRKEERN